MIFIHAASPVCPLLLGCIVIGIIGLALGNPGGVFREKSMPFTFAFWVSLFTFTFNWVRFYYSNLFHIGGWGLHWDVMWSLAVEEQFYLLLPLALILSKNSTRLVAWLLPIIGIGALSRYGMDHVGFANWKIASNSCFDALAMGVLTALYAQQFQRRFGSSFIGAGLFLLTVGCISYDPTTAPTIQAAGACAFMLGAQARDDLFSRAWNIPARIGVLSYEMYLLHPIVFGAIRTLITPNAGGTGLIFGWLAFAAITAFFSEAVHDIFTEPSNRALRKLFLRREATAAVAGCTRLNPPEPTIHKHTLPAISGLVVKPALPVKSPFDDHAQIVETGLPTERLLQPRGIGHQRRRIAPRRGPSGRAIFCPLTASATFTTSRTEKPLP